MTWFKHRESVSRAFAQQLTDHPAALGARARTVKALTDALASLEDKHERLRGKFYAARSESQPVVGTDKAAILAAWRRGEIKS